LNILPVIFLILGIGLGILIKEPLTGEFGVYVAVACLAGLDTICGGIRSNLESKFDSSILFTGFISNILIAFGLSWLGDRIGANIYLVCVLIFGQRIFTNLSVIRRIALTRWQDARARKKSELQAQQQAQSIQAGDSVS
jgi:small basic protein